MKESVNKANQMASVVVACNEIGGLLLSSGVIACAIYLLLTLASLMTVQPAFAQSAPVAAGVRLEAGIEKEDVDGDLKSAMDIYQKIAADNSAPRDIRAKALLRLARCDEKLGKQAEQIYEQIVHDYADMPAAAQARKRLAAIRQQEHPAAPTTMSVRKIEWAALGEMTACDTDGHRAVYRAADGNLYFGDLNGQNKRLVFKVQPGDVPVWCASRDLSMTALVFLPKPNRPARLAVIKNDGTSYRELVQDDAQRTVLGLTSTFEFDWSWDTRNLLVSGDLPNGGSHLMIVDVADGHHRELVHLPTAALGHAAFSPDGHSIAYSTWQATGSSADMEIFVMPTEGAEAHRVYQTPMSNDEGIQNNVQQQLHDWTADGRYLVISDVQFRKLGLYLLPLKNGVAAGNPVFVREGQTGDAHTIASGALVFKDWPAHSNEFIAFLATLDPDGKLGAWQQLDIRGGNSDWFPGASFSPNGTQIAYLSGDEERGGRDLVLRNLKSGQERVLHWFNSGRPDCRHSYDSSNVFCFVGWDDNGGHSDLISVATESGALENLGSFSDYRARITPRGDQRIYFMAMKGIMGGHYVRWDASARQDTVLEAIPRELDQFYVPTQDERWLIRADIRGLAIRPMSGGDWRFLVSAATGPVTEVQDVLPHGDWILFDAKDSEGKVRLYQIPVSGGYPQLIGDFPANSKSDMGGPYLQLSRDARQVIAQTKDGSKFNLWTLENFEPPLKK